MPLYHNFNFAILDDPDFREDSVREELIVPLLSHLGYSAVGPHKILRSKRLVHPFVYIGTIKKGVEIIPDYVLQRGGKNSWVLDAKAPNEKIDSGRNVEQAFSYAIHKDVRVPLYALCNGREFIVFHISQWPHVLRFKLNEIDTYWNEIVSLLGTGIAPKPPAEGFLPDLGLSMWKAGLARADGKHTQFIFATIKITVVAKLDDNKYTITSVEEDTVGTFDFSESVYQELLTKLPSNYAKAIAPALTRDPFHLAFKKLEPIFVGVVAELPEEILTNENESYCPFRVKHFI